MKAWRLAVALVPALLACGAFAAAIEVSPVRHELAPSQPMLAMTVANRGSAPVNVQVRGFAWTQPGDGERLEPDAAIVVSPPIFRLDPGQRQVVRALVPGAARHGEERSWRLLVDEIPEAVEGDALRFALRLSIPVFRAGVAQRPARLQALVEPDRRGVLVRNTGGRHERLRDAVLLDAHGTRIELEPHGLAYVLGGTERRWRVGTGAATPVGALRLTGHGDAGPIDIPVEAAP